MATLFLANALYRMHFRVRFVSLCHEISSYRTTQLRSDIVQLESVNRRVTSMGQPQLKAYSKADQTTYHYYLGRIFLIQRRLTRVSWAPRAVELSSSIQALTGYASPTTGIRPLYRSPAAQ